MSVQRIDPRSGTSLRMFKGQLLKIVTPTGAQVCDLFCVNSEDPKESFSASRSIDYADQIFLSTGHLLYSNRSRAMFAIVEDSCGQHDLLMPPCSLKMFQIVAGNLAYHPSCLENLGKVLAPYGIVEDDISTTFNIFMYVTVDPSGKLQIEPPKAKAQDVVLIRAEMNLLVGLTACSHPQTNGGSCKAIHWEIIN